jgi:predicted porin
VSYQFQGLKIAGAYSQLNNPGQTTGGAVDTLATQGRVRTYGAAAGYAFGPAQVGAAWTQARLDNTGATGTSVRIDNYEVNGKYNLTPALGLGVAYTYSNARLGQDSAHWHQVGLQADYALSKRTDVYAQAVYQRASGANASIYNGNIDTLPSSSINQTAATVGLRHRF